jgi:hypothetical protein
MRYNYNGSFAQFFFLGSTFALCGCRKCKGTVMQGRQMLHDHRLRFGAYTLDEPESDAEVSIDLGPVAIDLRQCTSVYIVYLLQIYIYLYYIYLYIYIYMYIYIYICSYVGPRELPEEPVPQELCVLAL